MQQKHLPMLGARYWTALCLASIFGANMGDFFARNLGLGHVAGLPFLALAFAIVDRRRALRSHRPSGVLLDRHHHRQDGRDQLRRFRLWRHEAAAALGDRRAGGGYSPSPRRQLAIGLASIVRQRDGSDNVLRADTGYWVSMFLAGTLGTVIGDYCSHDLHLGDAGASILLSPILALLLVIARDGLLDRCGSIG